MQKKAPNVSVFLLCWCIRIDISLDLRVCFAMTHPSTGRIKLHHDIPGCSRFDALVDEIVQKILCNDILKDTLGNRHDHLQFR